MYPVHVNRVYMKLGRISPSLCPKGTSFPSPWARKTGILLEWDLGGFWVQTGDRGREKRRRKNRKLTAGSLLVLSFVSFPNLPATMFQSPENAPYISPSAVWLFLGFSGLHSVGDRMECAYFVVTGMVTSPSVGFRMFIFEGRDVSGDRPFTNTFSVDATKPWQERLTATPDVNYGLRKISLQ